MAKTKTKKKSKKYTIELTPLSALVVGGILFVILAWMFILGIFASTLFQPESSSTVSGLKKQLKKVQEMVGDREEYEEIKPQDQDKDPELDFYEKLNSKKDEVKRTTLPEKEETPMGEITLYKDPSENETAEPVQEKVIEATEKIDAIKVKPPPPIGSDREFTIQIASTGNQEKAEELIKSLVDQGYDAYYYMAEVEGKLYYRLRVGRFDNRSIALEYLNLHSEKLEEETGNIGYVVRVE